MIPFKFTRTPAILLASVAGITLGMAALRNAPESTRDAGPGPSGPAAPRAGLSPDSGASAGPEDPEKVRDAVAAGLAYLRRIQDKGTGAWIQNVGYKFNSDYHITDTSVPHVGVTALACMAFLSGGHLPGRGEHGDVVERGTDFILASVNPERGYISGNGTRMYSHAFSALFLAEIYGMTHREDVKEKLQLAIDLTRTSQNAHGSWRYLPDSPESDMSITVCQIMALRAARNIGIRVPKSTIDRAYDYVVRSAYKNRHSPEYGGFKYQEKDRSRTSFALTSAGIATLNHTGVYDHELIKAGIHYLRQEMGPFNQAYGGSEGHYFFWYGHYYGAQVFFHAGDDDPELWEFYWNRMSRELVASQERDGSWPNRIGPGTAFSTAIACIILQIPNQYLPIFHR